MNLLCARLVITGLSLAAAVGCSGGGGPQTIDVQGNVSLDGKPIESGQIYFRAEDGSNSYYGKIENGSYEAEVTPGEKRIEVYGYRDLAGKTREDNPGEQATVREMFVPEKFNRKTTLTLNLSADKAEAVEDFNLKSKD